MLSPFFSGVRRLPAEEKILNAGVMLTIASLFFPWLSGRWLADQTRTDSALSFDSYVSFIGMAILGLQVFVLLVTAVPLFNGTALVQPVHKNRVRLYANAVTAILTLASLSVLLKVTFDFPSMQIRFGVYGALIGGLLSSLYSFLLVQAAEKQIVHDLFYQTSESLVKDHARTLEPGPQAVRQELHLPPSPPRPEAHQPGVR
jgi:hypothetical protein